MNRYTGFSLVELMVAIAIIAILAGIAVPAYNGYITDSRRGAIRLNIDTLRIPLEDYRLENGNYGTNGTTYAGIANINTQYGWNPDGETAAYSYSVRAYATAGGTVSYDAWGVHGASGIWLRCDNRMSNCCDGTDGSPTACP